MNRFLVVVLVSSFALAGSAAEEKQSEPKRASCGMACCDKNKSASCKDCPECGKKKAAPKKDTPKQDDAKKG